MQFDKPWYIVSSPDGVVSVMISVTRDLATIMQIQIQIYNWHYQAYGYPIIRKGKKTTDWHIGNTCKIQNSTWYSVPMDRRSECFIIYASGMYGVSLKHHAVWQTLVYCLVSRWGCFCHDFCSKRSSNYGANSNPDFDWHNQAHCYPMIKRKENDRMTHR